MSTDIEQITTIKSQTLARIAEITAQPKPTYQIDGQLVSWGSYLAQLQQTVDWCNEKLAGRGPVRIPVARIHLMMASFDPSGDLAFVADGAEP